MINTTCFPVSYQEKYYKDVISSPAGQNNEGLSKLAYVGGFVVGATSSRIEDITTTTTTDSDAAVKDANDDESDNKKKNADVGDDDGGGGDKNNSNSSKKKKQQRIYIMTLGVLPAYRGRGIGTKLIQSILDYFEHNMTSCEEGLKDVTEVSLHVHVENQDAINFYTQKFGFLKGERVENYYNKRSVDPPHSIRLYKPLR
mmetsp:Transcript_35437/g.85764  ORF Transcript_35437/g.85764 Transcript_35437/m.85764 type:complete len:200 (+) Transcript_35437:838-1437(+)